jgi:thioesterase domain-containing protein
MTPVEAVVAEVWCQALGASEVGARDDFFTLGGHPLLAVGVMEELERRFHRGLSPAVIFQEGSTVEGLARLIARPALAPGAPASDLVFPLRPSGSRPPLFLVEPDRAGILALRGWLPVLGDRQPVAGLVPRTGAEGRFSAEASVEWLSSELVGLMRQNQREGPYRLAGHGFGGLLAYEMACQLHAAGQEVAFLALVETVHPVAAVAEARDRARATARLKRLLLAASRPRPAPIAEQDSTEAEEGGPVFDAAGALRLITGYPVTRFPGPMILVASEAGADPGLGWHGRHPGPLRVHPTLGAHRSIVGKANMLALAEELDRHLEP